MTDIVSPLELETFVPPRAPDASHRVASPLNGATMPVPGPGLPPRPDRDEVMTKIIRGLSNGLSLPAVLETLVEEGHPPVDVFLVHQWRHRYPVFSEAYDLARAVGAHALLDEARGDVDEATDREGALCARVKAETKIKLAEKWAPDRFGPRVQSTAGVRVTINTNLAPPDYADPRDVFRLSMQPLPTDMGNAPSGDSSAVPSPTKGDA